MQKIEKMTEQYARERDNLVDHVKRLHAELEAVKLRLIPFVREAVRRTSEAHSALNSCIEESPHLFVKPKTQIFRGIRVGYTKRKGKVEIDDEQAVIKRIRDKLPEDQAELLVRVKESVDKNAVGDLTATDLKRLGIRITDDQNAVVIKPVDSEVDKLVNALLAETEDMEADEAA